MSLHILKLCVGADSISDLEAWVATRLAERRRRNEPTEHWHTTRLAPKRAGELLDGGSLYWVIKGHVAARQAFLGIEAFIDGSGVSRCRFRLDATVVPVRPRTCRPFQGWRYLSVQDAPPDTASMSADVERLPETLREELMRLGLL